MSGARLEPRAAPPPAARVEAELREFHAAIDALQSRFPSLAAILLVGAHTDDVATPFRARPRAWGDLQDIQALWQKALPELLQVLRRESEAALRAGREP